MLSTQYRLRLEAICRKIVDGDEVPLTDMVWANKLGKANRSAMEMLQLARRLAFNPEMPEGSMDSFMAGMGLGDPDQSNHRKSFDSADEIVDWFRQEKTDDWRQRD